MRAVPPDVATALTPRVSSGLARAHTLHAVLLGIAAFAFAASMLSGWNAGANGTGVLFYLGLIVPITVGLAAYQFLWARRLRRGDAVTGAGLALGAILLFGVAPLSAKEVFSLVGLLEESGVLSADIARTLLDTVFGPLQSALVLGIAALGLGTILALLQPFGYRERAARWIGAIAGALVFEALVRLVQTLPAFLGSFAAYGIERDLTSRTPELATFAVSVAYAPFGVNGSGGEIWPIAVVIALVLPVALFLLRGARSLLAGQPLRAGFGIALGALVLLSSIAPFGEWRGDPVVLEYLLIDPMTMIMRASLPGLLLGVSLLAFTIKSRAVAIPLMLFGAAALLANLYGWVRFGVPLGGELFSNLINGFVLRFDPSEILYSISELLVFAALIALLLHAGVRERSDGTSV